MFRPTFIFCCCLLVQLSYGQQIMKGHVLENKTRIPLAGIKIENLRTRQTTETDTEGKFNISLALNDLLVLKSIVYQPDTILITDLKITEFFMEPLKTQLKEVNIHSEKPINLGTVIDPRHHGQALDYQTDANSAYKGGLVLRLGYLKKGGRKQNSGEQQQKNEAIMLQIDHVFSPANLKKYLPLNPEELTAFKIRYIPSVKVYMNNNFSLLTYLNSCYKEFEQLPPEKRVPEKLTE